MIDIHCHILPGIDDGASDLAESIEMAKQAEQSGIRTIVATPHHQNGRYENDRAKVEAEVAFLNSQLQAENIEVTIQAGQEVRLYGELLEDWQAGKLLALHNSNYMLIEFPSASIPRFAEQMLFDMQLAGITPVIAHPERNAAIAEEPNRLYKLVKNGALAQLTAGSLTGQFGKKIQKQSHQLIEANLIHFLASDAHNTTSRAIHLKEAYGIDSHYASYFQENAKALIEGRYVAPEPPQHVKSRQKLFGLF